MARTPPPLDDGGLKLRAAAQVGMVGDDDLEVRRSSATASKMSSNVRAIRGSLVQADLIARAGLTDWRLARGFRMLPAPSLGPPPAPFMRWSRQNVAARKNLSPLTSFRVVHPPAARKPCQAPPRRDLHDSLTLGFSL